MAKVGLKYPVYAIMEDDGTYTGGAVIAKAIKASVTAESNDVKLHADDGMAESDKSFKGGKISLNVDDLTNKVYCDLLGHKYTAGSESDPKTPETVLANGNDIAPFVGVGFYGKVVRSGKVAFLAKWLRKTQFAEPADETETKGDTINYQTPTIEGDVFQMDNGDWKDQAEFKNEADAKKWLETKAGISTTPAV